MEGDTSISKLVESRIFSILKEPKVIPEVRQRLELSNMVFKKVELSKNSVSNAERLWLVQDYAEKLSSNVAYISKTIDVQPLNQAAEVEKGFE